MTSRPLSVSAICCGGKKRLASDRDLGRFRLVLALADLVGLVDELADDIEELIELLVVECREDFLDQLFARVFRRFQNDAPGVGDRDDLGAAVAGSGLRITSRSRSRPSIASVTVRGAKFSAQAISVERQGPSLLRKKRNLLRASETPSSVINSFTSRWTR